MPPPSNEEGEEKSVADFLDVFEFELVKSPHAHESKSVPVIAGRALGSASLTHVKGTGHCDGGMTDVGTGVAGLISQEEDVSAEDALDVLQGPIDLRITGDAAVRLDPVPLDCEHLQECYYLHGLFEESFLTMLEELSHHIPGDTSSNNMAATRRFFQSEKLGKALLARLPGGLGYSRVMPAMRFIEYDVGGYIRPHTDGVMFDQVCNCLGEGLV